MPGYFVVGIVIFAGLGVIACVGGCMMFAFYVVDYLWERMAARRRARRELTGPRETVGELRGHRWNDYDNDLYLTNFDAWSRGISPEGSTSE